MSTNVLFMCPHGAGKSVLAATYFRSAAAGRGLDVMVETAGIEPDEHNMPNVVEALENQGYSIDWTPKLVDEALTESADVVVSVGCDHACIPTDDEILEWDVPMLSNDFDASMKAIRELAENLAVELG